MHILMIIHSDEVAYVDDFDVVVKNAAVDDFVEGADKGCCLIIYKKY